MANHTRVVLEAVEGTETRLIARFESGARMPLGNPSGPWGPNPVEAVLGALGGCTAIDVIGILRKKRQTVREYEVVVEAQRREEHPRVFTRIEVVHRLRGPDLSPVAIEEAIRLSDTRYCTVHAALAPGTEIASRFEIVPD